MGVVPVLGGGLGRPKLTEAPLARRLPRPNLGYRQKEAVSPRATMPSCGPSSREPPLWAQA
jgi:hypothetical protein